MELWSTANLSIRKLLQRFVAAGAWIFPIFRTGLLAAFICAIFGGGFLRGCREPWSKLNGNRRSIHTTRRTSIILS